MIDKGTSVSILDTRPRAIFEKGHIKGAVSFPWKARITLQDISAMPRDRLTVTYCDCGQGEESAIGSALDSRHLSF
jgi:rhodanese-related sulfurtransferase